MCNSKAASRTHRRNVFRGPSLHVTTKMSKREHSQERRTLPLSESDSQSSSESSSKSDCEDVATTWENWETHDQLSWQQQDVSAPQSEYEQESIATETFHRDVSAEFPTYPMRYVTILSLSSRRDSSSSPMRRWSHPTTEQFVRAYLRGSSTKRDVVLPLTMGSLQVSGTMESSTA